MTGLEAQIAKAFDDQGILAAVEPLGSGFAVRFEVDGHRATARFNPIASAACAPEDTHFFATTWIEDPLEAFGKRMDMRQVDGWHKDLPDTKPRHGLPADIVPALLDAVRDYVGLRWPAPSFS